MYRHHKGCKTSTKRGAKHSRYLQGLQGMQGFYKGCKTSRRQP